ncbi:MAG: hypothetical protein HOP29_13830, partial [Phycisphaerales bacterium]|nr:hypothetical protein [Phycisphaerales bacterium]
MVKAFLNGGRTKRPAMPVNVFGVFHLFEGTGRRPGDGRIEGAPRFKKPRACARGSDSGFPTLNTSLPVKASAAVCVVVCVVGMAGVARGQARAADVVVARVEMRPLPSTMTLVGRVEP